MPRLLPKLLLQLLSDPLLSHGHHQPWLVHTNGVGQLLDRAMSPLCSSETSWQNALLSQSSSLFSPGSALPCRAGRAQPWVAALYTARAAKEDVLEGWGETISAAKEITPVCAACLHTQFPTPTQAQPLPEDLPCSRASLLLAQSLAMSEGRAVCPVGGACEGIHLSLLLCALRVCYTMQK